MIVHYKYMDMSNIFKKKQDDFLKSFVLRSICTLLREDRLHLSNKSESLSAFPFVLRSICTIFAQTNVFSLLYTLLHKFFLPICNRKSLFLISVRRQRN